MMADTAIVTEAGYKTEIMNAHIVTHTANNFMPQSARPCKSVKVRTQLYIKT